MTSGLAPRRPGQQVGPSLPTPPLKRLVFNGRLVEHGRGDLALPLLTGRLVSVEASQ